jgi:hypothetical protein
MAASFGAPVIDPGGKVAASSSGQPTPARSSPATVDTRWTRPGWCSTASRAGTHTEPKSQTRPRSLRTRSTIITFSARSLSRNSSGAAAVPLIGEDHTRRPSRRRNRSGDADATCTPAAGTRTTAEYGAGFPTASAAPRAATSASGATGAQSWRVRFTWYTSPASMAARIARTPFSKPSWSSDDRHAPRGGPTQRGPRQGRAGRTVANRANVGRPS